VNLYYVTAVGDNLGRITDTLRHGLERSDLIITTGGLGPTVDDMTRQGVAAATDRELEFHQTLLDEIAARFEKFGTQMTENNRQQAYVPAGAIIVHNPVGTAPCFIVESEQGIIISLPGVPREMKYLMEHSILPYLRQKMGLPAIIKARVLHTAGIGESMLDTHVGEFMTLSNPTVGLAAHAGQTDIRITARADSEAQADAMIAELESQIRQRVGQHIYGTDGEKLEAVVARTLRERGIKMVVLEAGTGGKVAERLSKLENLPAVVEVLENYATIDDLLGQTGVNGGAETLRETAAQIIQTVCSQHQAGVGVAVLHQPDGMTALAIYTPQKAHSRELHMGSGDDAASWAFGWGLGYVWRYLTETAG
jgi:nicotinamide-nucleotide amidase